MAMLPFFNNLFVEWPIYLWVCVTEWKKNNQTRNDRHGITRQLLQLSNVHCHNHRRGWFRIMKHQRYAGTSNHIILYVRKLGMELNGSAQGHTGAASELNGVVVSLFSTCSPHSAVRMTLCQLALLYRSPAQKPSVAPFVSGVRAMSSEQWLAAAQGSVGEQTPAMKINGQLQQQLGKSHGKRGRSFGFNSQWHHYPGLSGHWLSPSKGLVLLICKCTTQTGGAVQGVPGSHQRKEQ